MFSKTLSKCDCRCHHGNDSEKRKKPKKVIRQTSRSTRINRSDDVQDSKNRTQTTKSRSEPLRSKCNNGTFIVNDKDMILNDMNVKETDGLNLVIYPSIQKESNHPMIIKIKKNRSSTVCDDGHGFKNRFDQIVSNACKAAYTEVMDKYDPKIVIMLQRIIKRAWRYVNAEDDEEWHVEYTPIKLPNDKKDEIEKKKPKMISKSTQYLIKDVEKKRNFKLKFPEKSPMLAKKSVLSQISKNSLYRSSLPY